MWALLAIIIALAIAVSVTVASRISFSSDTLRKRVVATLSDRLDSRVEVAGVTVRFFPGFQAELSDLIIRHKQRTDLPPLLVVKRLAVDAGLLGLLNKHVDRVAINGLEINIPPHDDDEDSPPDRLANAHRAQKRAGGWSLKAQFGGAKDVVIDHLVATEARLVIIPKTAKKLPKVWELHHLDTRSVSFETAMPFESVLTNAVPPGDIHVKGHFGPWAVNAPAQTPLDGAFTFDDANLGVFKGISGTLSAHGGFSGTLGRIKVAGETYTPQFTVAVGGHAVPLRAAYQTTVDGTNGNTLLDRIDASFLNTSLVAAGSVIDTPGKKGRTVVLDIKMDKARLEDVLQLAVPAPTPPMTGALRLTTRFVLPPDDRDVVDKLRLDGQFELMSARFTSLDIQQKVDELSRRSRGDTSEAPSASVLSNFHGRFKLRGGALSFDTLEFETKGARVQLAGTYALRPEDLHFKGTLLIDAKISETQKGWKRLLLKPLDPIFRTRNGKGSELPIKIEGRRNDPAFGIDRSRLFKRHG
ncbi:MAG: hypothetical protein C5B57_07675 [Blastocatellia bacterium]|nr:MAG: hypothetical protein C5B57_07675 [Blastocatellia bacterium]